MNVAKAERAALCAELDRLGPDAPTLCGQWTTGDLAAHLWVRENDPLAAPGIVFAPLVGLTARRMAAARRRWSYAELVDRVRRGPARWSMFALPGVDAAANATEYFVHHEDVRRANGQREPRPLGTDAEQLLWRRLRPLARMGFRRSPVGVVLEDGARARIQAAAGSRIVTLVGQPSELLLFAFGRGEQAVVEFVGDDDAVAQVKALPLGL